MKNKINLDDPSSFDLLAADVSESDSDAFDLVKDEAYHNVMWLAADTIFEREAVRWFAVAVTVQRLSLSILQAAPSAAAAELMMAHARKYVLDSILGTITDDNEEENV